MGPWRSLRQLREDFKASGQTLPPRKRLPDGPGTGDCRGKLRHGTPDDAERHLVTLASAPSEKQRRHRLNVYRCKWCDGYHVGHRRSQMKRVA